MYTLNIDTHTLGSARQITQKIEYVCVYTCVVVILGQINASSTVPT
jgi:hypothetical protein